jgi:beta-glucosidase
MKSLRCTSLLIITLAGCAARSDFKLARNPIEKPAAPSRNLTDDFWWGVSSSSFQTEDAGPDDENLGFKTDWDLAHESGFIKYPRANGVGSYTQFGRDIAAMKSLGVTHYRFSVEWARVEPTPDRFNEAAIGHYVQMCKAFREAGITPIVALWHFTFPAWLSAKTPDDHGWLHRDFQSHWKPYVARMVEALAPYVDLWAPENEPNTYALGALVGELPPGGGRASYSRYLKTLNIEADAFHRAATLIRRKQPNARIIAIENIIHWKPDAFDFGRFWYTKGVEYNYYHLDKIVDDCDLIGINYYFSEVASPLARLAQSLRSGPKVSDLGWIIDPAGLEAEIVAMSNRYGKPMLITENGIADRTDKKRPGYIADHLRAIERTRCAGYDVRGYFHWTLVDNFEWAEGYTAKFGLFSLDAQTRELVPKASCETYRSLIQHKVPSPMPSR